MDFDDPGARDTMTLVPIDDLRKRLDFGFM